MNNKTTYSFELLLKLNLFISKNKKRRLALTAILEILLGIVFLAATYITQDIVDPVLVFFGIAFLATAFICITALVKSRKNAVSAQVSKQLQENSAISIEYEFDDEHISVDFHSEQVQTNSKIKYSYVSSVEKIDNKTCYFLAKNGTYYLIYDEQGIDGYFSHIAERI
ncbi:MAG: hypothetical protein E7653_01620 [Ruminococcaceae bacterium]|nr:hypothetical protein [Oscillospiraceae bacterium]